MVFPSSPAALGIPAKAGLGGEEAEDHWQATPTTPERAKAVPHDVGLKSTGHP